jgi:predicted GNAT family acetyltransferase
MERGQQLISTEDRSVPAIAMTSWRIRGNRMGRETETLKIENNESAQRFEVRIDGHEAFVQYRYTDGGDLVLSHTEVPPALGGRGLGGKLAGAALDFARSRNLTVVVTCPFITNYINKHAEYHALLRKEFGG